MTTRYLPEEELIRRGLAALMQNLGPVETARFLTLPRRPRVESVERHRRWQDGLDQTEFFAQIFGSTPPMAEDS